MSKQEEAKEALKKKPEAKKVDNELELKEYQTFTELFFLSLRPKAKLKDAKIKEMKELGERIKKRSGKVPKKNKTIPLSLEYGLVRIAAGYPIPKLIHDEFKKKGINDDIYFE